MAFLGAGRKKCPAGVRPSVAQSLKVSTGGTGVVYATVQRVAREFVPNARNPSRGKNVARAPANGIMKRGRVGGPTMLAFFRCVGQAVLAKGLRGLVGELPFGEL